MVKKPKKSIGKNKKPAKKTERDNVGLNYEVEIAELQTLLRALGEEAIMMRDGGKLAEKEKAYFGDIVTEADKLIEQDIIKRLHARHPSHRVHGEESGVSGPTESPYEWIVNPIDGTINFSKGSDFYSIAVALFEHGVPKMGILYFPSLARFVYAIRGKGAYDNGKPLKVFQRSKPIDMRHALIAGAITRQNPSRMPLLSLMRMQGMNLVNTGSTTYNSILLAEHKLDASIHTDATLFNVAAVIPIIEEIGGVVSGIAESYPNLKRERIPIIFTTSPELVDDIKKHLLTQWEK